MRRALKCPKCEGRKLFVIEQVRTTDGAAIVTRDRAVSRSGREESLDHEDAGHFEAWVCALCGFTEWYARDATEALMRMARHTNSKVRYIDGDAGTGPYR